MLSLVRQLLYTGCGDAAALFCSNCLLESNLLGEVHNLKVTVTSTLRCRVTAQVTVKTLYYSLNL